MAAIADWTARVTSTGVTFFPPDGRSVAGVHVRERLRPLRSVKAIVADEVARLAPILGAPTVGPIERLLTDEAEHAALVSVRATSTIEKAPILFQFGFVFGDDFYDQIEGWMTDETRFGELDEIMRSAIRMHNLCLGPERHRWFDYKPPANWQGFGRGMLTEWYPLDFPKHFARISVPPAFIKKSAPVLIETLMSRRMINFKRIGQADVETVDFNGLKGVVTRSIGEFPGSELRATHIVTVALKDAASHLYIFRLESTAKHYNEDAATLFEVVKSIQGVPLGSLQARAEVMAWVIE